VRPYLQLPANALALDLPADSKPSSPLPGRCSPRKEALVTRGQLTVIHLCSQGHTRTGRAPALASACWSERCPVAADTAPS